MANNGMDLVFSESAKAAFSQLRGEQGTVLGLCLLADMGSIADLLGSGSQKRLEALFARYPEGREAAREMFASACEDARELLRRARTGEIVRIWYSDAPAEMCGMLHAVNLLEKCSCPILLGRLPDMLPQEDSVLFPDCWGETELPVSMEAPRELRQWERCAYARQWEQLVRQNAPLRAVVNGRVCSVPADFYDSWILREIPEGEFREALLIGRVLGDPVLRIHDAWIAGRIAALEQSGVLEQTASGEDDHPYMRILRRK